MTREQYHETLQPQRIAFADHAISTNLIDSNLTPEVFLRFLIEYSSLGVQITEPVEGWILRAGERCTELGMPKTGDLLRQHARDERNHHLMMVEDTQKLVAFHNLFSKEQLNPKNLIERKSTPMMDAYIKLHEDVINSNFPVCQVAIEREIEGLAVSYVPHIIERAQSVMGELGVKNFLSFLPEHVLLDVGHTAFNERLLDTVFEEAPNSLSEMTKTGEAALNTYLHFFGECLDLAKEKSN